MLIGGVGLRFVAEDDQGSEDDWASAAGSQVGQSAANRGAGTNRVVDDSDGLAADGVTQVRWQAVADGEEAGGGGIFVALGEKRLRVKSAGEERGQVRAAGLRTADSRHVVGRETLREGFDVRSKLREIDEEAVELEPLVAVVTRFHSEVAVASRDKVEQGVRHGGRLGRPARCSKRDEKSGAVRRRWV